VSRDISGKIRGKETGWVGRGVEKEGEALGDRKRRGERGREIQHVGGERDSNNAKGGRSEALNTRHRFSKQIAQTKG